MKILSLFDGISATNQALKNLGIECEYYASEIDPLYYNICVDRLSGEYDKGTLI